MARAWPVLLLLCAPLAAQTPAPCSPCLFTACHSARLTVPAALHGELRPTESLIPLDRSSASKSNFLGPSTISRWIALDASPGWLWAATGFRLQSWSLANPADPERVGDLSLAESGVAVDITGHSESVWADIAIAGDRLVVAGQGAGVAVFDVRDRRSLTLLYQDPGDARRLYVEGSTVYAAGFLDGRGVRVYDLATPTRLGTLGTMERASSISGWGDGWIAAGTQPFGGPGGALLFDVTHSTANPSAVVLPGEWVGDVAAWSAGGVPYLAVRTSTRIRIFERGNLAAPLWTASAPLSSAARLSLSWSDGVPMLYSGSGLTCRNGDTGEMLLDVTDPRAPRAVMGPEYWRWYSWDSPTGANYMAPNDALFVGKYLYRAGGSYLDVHERRTGAPATAVPAATLIPTPLPAPTRTPTPRPIATPRSELDLAIDGLDAAVSRLGVVSAELASSVVARITGIEQALVAKIPTPMPRGTVTPTVTRTRTPTPRPLATATLLPPPWARTPDAQGSER